MAAIASHLSITNSAWLLGCSSFQPARVGNSLFGFSSKSLAFFVSERAKVRFALKKRTIHWQSNGSVSLLGIKREKQWKTVKNMVKIEMWWLIGSSPDYWGSGSGFESGISHSGKTLRTGRVTVYTVKSRGREGSLPLRSKKKEKRKIYLVQTTIFFSFFERIACF